MALLDYRKLINSVVGAGWSWDTARFFLAWLSHGSWARWGQHWK